MKTFAAAGLFLVIAAAPALATDERDPNCRDCPAPRPHYDSQEVVRTSRDVDRSRVINTTTEVPVSRKVRETNHLVIRENETRHIGVVRHNHTIIEKEIRYKRRVPAPPVVVNFVTQDYRTVHRPATVTVDVDVEPAAKPRRKLYRAPLRVRG